MAYAFLRAARDDFLAVQDGRPEDQQAAFDLQLRLAAANHIKAAHDQRHARKVAPVRHTREEAGFLVARHWTPIVSHYVDNFDDERQAMISRMRTVPRSDDKRDVLLDVSRADSRARVRIALAHEQGDDGKKYWRILQVGYANPQAKRINVSMPATTTTTTPAGS